MKILVTGGTGVIGAAAVPALLRAGHEVRLLSRKAESDAGEYPAGVEAHAADIGNPEELRDAAAGCGCVLHIAGIAEEEPPEITFEKVNVDGTRNVLGAARRAGLPYFIYLSSLGAERGESRYHQSKARAEELVRDYAGPWLILRPGNVYGPGDETLSMLLKMNRSLPAVPLVADGDQPFQPLWYSDLGHALVQAVARPELARTELDLAGPEVTTTNEVFDRLAAITGRAPKRIGVPAWLAQFGAAAVESFGALGAKVLKRGGLAAPITSAKLTMLLEGSVIPPGRPNALTDVFQVPTTPLQDGLEMLADLLPEQTPGSGVGAIERTTYAAEIRDSRYDAATLLESVRDHLTELMPLEFDSEPGVPASARAGETLTGTIPGRGNFQIRLEEAGEHRLQFVTVAGHPLAGLLTLATDPIPGGVRFSIQTITQPANVLDWAALRLVGGFLQAQNWRKVVRRVIELSGGSAPDGIRVDRQILNEAEADELKVFAQNLVQNRQRNDHTRPPPAVAARTGRL